MMAGAALRLATRGRLILDNPSDDLSEILLLVGGRLPWLRIGNGEEVS
jgi:hypothetical protein